MSFSIIILAFSNNAFAQSFEDHQKREGEEYRRHMQNQRDNYRSNQGSGSNSITVCNDRSKEIRVAVGAVPFAETSWGWTYIAAGRCDATGQTRVTGWLGFYFEERQEKSDRYGRELLPSDRSNPTTYCVMETTEGWSLFSGKAKSCDQVVSGGITTQKKFYQIYYQGPASIRVGNNYSLNDTGEEYSYSMPSDMIGFWTGSVRQQNYRAYSVNIFVNSSRSAIVFYPELNCGGKLTLAQGQPGSWFFFNEAMTHRRGDCIVGGQVLIARTKSNTLSWKWFYNTGKLGSNSTLNSVPHLTEAQITERISIKSDR